MSPPLVQTKFYIPSVRPELVSRPSLIERLDEGLDIGRRLTLISAPAGFGKTTLLAEWVRGISTRRSSPPRIAWLSLDEDDNDPARFLAYLVAAIETAGEKVLSREPPVAPPLPQPSSLEERLAGLINQINAVPVVLVLALDDYHLITAQPVHDAIAFLLDRLPANMHLVIATRADPPLPVARLRGRGQLTELRLPDLRFSPTEAAEFLTRVMGLELTADTVRALEALTEGWIAGLQMAGVALRGALSAERDAAGFVRDFTGSNRFILDYLIEEVLQHQPGHIQAFLLQTSILERLCGPLCSAVAVGVGEWEPENGRQPGLAVFDRAPKAILEYLELTNLFVLPLDNRREWYRYHRLFADLLHSRLQQAYPDLVPVLHRRASAWHEQHGLMTEAIDHALAACDLERAADLIEQHAEDTLLRGEVATFLRWVDALPDELLSAHPSLSVLQAWMLLMHGQPMEIVEAHLPDGDQGDDLVAGRLAAFHGLAEALRGDVVRAAELSRRALDQLSEEEKFARGYATWILNVAQLVRAEGSIDIQALDEILRMSQRSGNVMLSIMIVCNRAELLMRDGQLREAAASYRRALELATDAHGRRLPVAGQALIGLAELAREWGQLDVAVRDVLEGIRLTEQWSEIGPFDAYIVLARIRRAQGDPDGAWEALQRARELAVRFDLTQLDDLTVAMFSALQRLSDGELDAVQRWAEDRDLYRHIDTPLEERADDPYEFRLRKYELLVLARLLTAQGRPGEAVTLLESLIPVAERRHRPGMLMEIYTLQALACQAQGDLDRAVALLARALVLAEPEDRVQVFLDEGEPIVQLLREAAKRGVATAYVRKLLAAPGQAEREAPAGTPPAPAGLAELLSTREAEVLRLLDTHLTSTEIAEQLYISTNTARYHIKNIYGKLGVHRRSDAVGRARELGLL